MSARKFRTSFADAGQALGPWLARRLGIDDVNAAAAIAGGRVYLDGKRVRDAEAVLAAALTVTVHDDPGTGASTPGVASTSTPPLTVVVHTADVLVVDKPAGLACQAERRGGPALDRAVQARHLGATLVHRIDRDTSGLVLFALNERSRAALARAMGEGAIEREYLAEVAGAPAEERFTIDAPIGPDPRARRRQAAGVPGGLAARTHVEVVARRSEGATLRCRLDTGRTHQIRVHLAHVGLPILGDPLYAPAAVAARSARLMLHAERLRWPGGEARSSAPWPNVGHAAPGSAP
jgi:23S rRNA pseudouridine1911/1915/1917 synthase